MVVVLSGKAKQEMAYSTRLTNAFGGRDYAAAGLCDFLLGALLDWLLGIGVSGCSFSGLAQARGGLPPAMSQLAVVLPVVSWPRPTPQLCLRYWVVFNLVVVLIGRVSVIW
ncbi:hypothetical protein CSV80_05330 [Sporosarcina sp. P12(2017)]|uniref:hypothetical protein n=1 Tax=unclassified Sporosarcina TaxID=2647733 RepID=UPI000C16437B|nr:MULTISPECIES: hypothetical protein [unclassified Sporosarcina]PIC58389.1 hypothetical protein CSV81_04400 [Sporosarcina sp. P10]PIC61446.1 hypothetical protein CSV80_05330 [Sporosarcina sp. P12(2017)]